MKKYTANQILSLVGALFLVLLLIGIIISIPINKENQRREALAEEVSVDDNLSYLMLALGVDYGSTIVDSMTRQEIYELFLISLNQPHGDLNEEVILNVEQYSMFREIFFNYERVDMFFKPYARSEHQEFVWEMRSDYRTLIEQMLEEAGFQLPK